MIDGIVGVIEIAHVRRLVECWHAHTVAFFENLLATLRYGGF